MTFEYASKSPTNMLPILRIQTHDFILGVSLRGGALGATPLGPGYRCKPRRQRRHGFTLYPSRKYQPCF
jgi:hypothetical protein